MFQAYFKVLYSLLNGGEITTIEDPLWSVHGYQLLPLATSQLVGDNREYHPSSIFWGVLLIAGGDLIAIEDPSLSTHSY